MGRMGYPQPKAVCPRAGKLLLLLHYLRTDPVPWPFLVLYIM